MSLPWPTNFPEVVSNRTVDLVQKHPLFSAAKHGDRDAAWDLVCDLGDQTLMSQAGRRFSNARLLVVASTDSWSNKIPLAYAHLFERCSGRPLELGVLKANRPAHTGSDAYQRFLNRAVFKGTILGGENYLLLDDVSTQGGTLSELRQFVHREGANVIGVACLAHTPSKVMGNGRQLAPSVETIDAIDRKHGLGPVSHLLADLNIYDGHPYCLTESEALMILREPNLNEFRTKLSEASKPRVHDLDPQQGLQRRRIVA